MYLMLFWIVIVLSDKAIKREISLSNRDENNGRSV